MRRAINRNSTVVLTLDGGETPEGAFPADGLGGMMTVVKATGAEPAFVMRGARAEVSGLPDVRRRTAVARPRGFKRPSGIDIGSAASPNP